MYFQKYIFIAQETVRLIDGKYPEVWLNGKWSPICGHGFWDNNYGAIMFCRKLNPLFISGIVRKGRERLESDAIRVGRCDINDKWLQCTGGCNDLGIGNGCAKCRAGEDALIEIKCSQGGIFLKLLWAF